jgi:hypothetical protein
MKKLLLIIIFIFILTKFNYAIQDTTITIATMEAEINTDILIPVTVAKFDNIGAIGLWITFDPEVLIYDSLLNVDPQIYQIASSAGYNDIGSPDGNKVLKIGWFTTGFDGANLGTGKIFDIKCKYLGGATAVSFHLPQCIVSDNSDFSKTINASYIDGSVSPATSVRKNITENTFNVYPNPSNGHFNIQLDKPYENISILDLSGKVVYNKSINRTDMALTVDSNLTRGIYLIRLSSGKKVSYNKLLIQ